VVVGPKGSEIHTDPEGQGRVKVQFHWDRYGKRDEKSSCWIRVSQPWAGKGWGALSIPRVGQEVLVDFLDGNPDRPIITGGVYNQDQIPPFEPGDLQGVVSGVRSKTHRGEGHNSVAMDDTRGSELLELHAQRDMKSTVLNDRSVTVKGALDELIVEAGARQVTSQEDASLTVKKGSRLVDVQQGSYALTAATKAKIESPVLDIGNAEIKIHGTDVVIEGTTITLSAPGGSITIDAAGVSIEGNLVDSTAKGNHVIKGAMVQIN